MVIDSRISSEDGYSLISAILISLLLTTLILGLITQVLFSNLLAAKNINKKKLDLLCKTAIDLEKLKPIPDSSLTYFVEIDSSLVLVNKRLKGLFTEITAKAKSHSDSSKLQAILAGHPVPEFNNALTLSEQNAQLAVTGNTTVTGNILFSGKKISKGRILGLPTADKDFLRGSLLQNETVDSKNFRDSLLINQLQISKSNFDTSITSKEFVMDESNFQDFINKEVSVQGRLLISGDLFSQAKGNSIKLKVGDKTIISKGTKTNINIEINNDSSVVIEENSIIENLVVLSKSSITIGKNSTFANTQFISGRNISIANSHFSYPTIICLYVDATKDSLLNSSIDISSAVINGSVLLICSTTGVQKNKSKILINDSVIKGTIYSENYTEVSGSIIGSLLTYRLRYYKRPTEYINWMVNLKINRDKLEPTFLGPVTFKNGNNFETLKETWIY